MAKPAADAMRMGLVHLVRNALDHGLGSREERTERGKKPVGRITWNVALQDAWLCITCKDDGRGLDLDRLQIKAKRLGRMSNPSSRETHDLTEPGRGVGMDALRSILMDAGGKVYIRILDDTDSAANPRPFETVIELPGHVWVNRRDETWVGSLAEKIIA